MFLLYILLVILLTFNLHTVINVWRFNIGIIPINFFELGSALVVLNCLFIKPSKHQLISPQRHNFLWLVLFPYMLPIFISVFFGIFRKIPAYIFVQALRNYGAIPMGVVLGYWAVKNLDQVRRFVKWIALLCIPMGLLTIAHISSHAQGYEITGGGVLRTVSYLPAAGGVVATFIVYSTAINRNFFNRFISIVILTFGVIASAGTLTRSLWITLAASILSVVMMTPKELRAHSWRALFTSGIWITCALILGLMLSWFVLRIDMVGIVSQRTQSLFTKLDNPEGAYLGRWVGIVEELKIWLRTSILFGSGLGYIGKIRLTSYEEIAFGHCAYTYTLSQTGLLGFLPLILIVWIGIPIGRRMSQSMNLNVRAAGILALCNSINFGIQSLLSTALSGERAGLFYGLVLGMAIKCYRFQDEPEPYYDGYLEYDDLSNEYMSEPVHEEIQY